MTPRPMVHHISLHGVPLTAVWDGAAYISIGEPHGDRPFVILNVWDHTTRAPQIADAQEFQQKVYQWATSTTAVELRAMLD